MDNITHSLVGYLVGKTAQSVRTSRTGDEERTKRAVLWAAILGNNFPDLDFLISMFEGNTTLAYLLHHRGYTHTFLVAGVLGILVAFISKWICKAPLRGLFTLIPIAVFSTCLHIVADFANEYGVHPFWPWDMRWFYGDFLFIIEPIVWLILVPYLISDAKRLTTRILGYALWAIMIGLLLGGPFVPKLYGLALTVLSILVFRTLKKLPKLRLASVWALTVAALGLFWTNSQTTQKLVRAGFQTEYPNNQLLELALTPSPANPWCFTGLAVSLQDDFYVVRSFRMTRAPQFFTSASCFSKIAAATAENPQDIRPVTTAPTLTLAQTPIPGLEFTSEYRAPLMEGKKLVHSVCQMDQLLRFARVPYWLNLNNRLVVGDLRYDMEAGLGFSELEVNTESGKCLENPPKWIPPLRHLFE